jgi:S-adenosylmethionine synthetase
MAKNGRHLFTSESVTEGHPDKIADQISDAVLDALLAQDAYSRVACETVVTTGLAFIAGEVTSKAYADLPGIVRETIKGVGYTRAKYGFDYETCAVINAIHEQSPDIAMGVDPGGAGDQGLMFGFACNETEELMPLPIMLAHKLTRRLSQVRKEEILDYLRPDGKSQVTVEYDGDRPVRVEAVIISAQHSSLVKIETIREDVLEKVIHAVIPPSLLDSKTKYFINPTGRFVVGGPQGDCGLTGPQDHRRTPTAAWAATAAGPSRARTPRRWTARPRTWPGTSPRTSWPRGLADRLELQIAYAIGVADPVSSWWTPWAREGGRRAAGGRRARGLPLTPKGIIEYLNLRRPIYKKTAAYGHFGRSEDEFTWERTDKVEALRGLLRR